MRNSFDIARTNSENKSHEDHPRYRLATGHELYRIMACPGANDDADLRALIAEKPAGMPGEITIGPLHEYTRDVDDTRLERTPSERRRGKRADYVTVCRRLVERARDLGRLIES